MTWEDAGTQYCADTPKAFMTLGSQRVDVGGQGSGHGCFARLLAHVEAHLPPVKHHYPGGSPEVGNSRQGSETDTKIQ